MYDLLGAEMYREREQAAFHRCDLIVTI